MLRHLVAVQLLVHGTCALADRRAVESANFEMSIAAGDTLRAGTRAENFYGINARGVFALGDYVGAALSVDGTRTNLGDAFRSQTGAVTASGAPPECEIDSSRVDADLFLRDASVGRVGLRYGAGQARSKCAATFLPSGTGSLDSQTAVAEAEYYFARITLGASRAYTRFDGSVNLDAATLSASWYPADNVRLRLAADGLDFQDTYRFDVHYQPALVGNAIDLFAGYTLYDLPEKTHTIMVGISYFFDTRVELLTRDRHYR
jgi:hypothetical protein